MSEISFEELVRDPHKFGAPTFEEFKRNREKWLGRDDETLASAEKGSQTLREVVNRYIYEVEGYRCKSLEEVERVAASQGIPLKELDYRPQVIPQGGGKWECVIKFVSKNERARRNGLERSC